MSLNDFKRNVDFDVPEDYLKFIQKPDQDKVENREAFLMLWELEDLVELNEDYCVNEFAPDFFLFGSDGGDTAYGFMKENGKIYSMPFIGMSNEEAIFLNDTFTDFLNEV